VVGLLKSPPIPGKSHLAVSPVAA